MGSDLGKLHRRNYMVKSQLNSLEAKSKALNQRINGETNIDEWAQSYVARADAQIDDVSDYMQFRKLGSMTDSLPQVTLGNTLGTTLFLGLLGAGVGLITYSQRQSKTNLASMKPRLRKAAFGAAIGMGAAVAYQGASGLGQQTGWY